MPRHPVVTLIDVDNTLLDNDAVTADLRNHLIAEVGRQRQGRYWEIFEELREQVGYADYLGALQRYRVERPRDSHLLALSMFLIDYPFANRLYPGSLDVIAHVRRWGPAVVLSDGDVVFQPRKIHRAGLFEAVEGNILVYIHKEQELADVERRYPARHYIMVDDKPRLLDAIKRAGSTKGTAIRDALVKTDLNVVSGRVTFDANRNPVKSAVIIEIKNGKQVYKTTVNP
jgi:FMN phosphatase YigB (HAD superfamily)